MTLNGIIIQMCFKCTILGMYFFDFRERERGRGRKGTEKRRREKDLKSGLKLSLEKWVFDWIIIHESKNRLTPTFFWKEFSSSYSFLFSLSIFRYHFLRV